MTRAQDIPRDPRAPAVARRMVDDLGDVLDPAAADRARLLLSEVVTNAVRHGEGDAIRILLDARGASSVLRCEVTDEGPGFVPAARNKPATDEGGWGLQLVATLAHRWGVRDGRTQVWFELAAPAGA